MIVPEVKESGGSGTEAFEEYFSRWPRELGNFPRDVVENWVYRHWRDFRRHWYHPMGAPMHDTQLIEGHLRLAYLRGMIRHNHPSLRDRHEVWALCLPRNPFELPRSQAEGS